MKIVLNLRMFEGGHSVTVVYDDGFSAASASATSDVAKDTEVTISTTLVSGYELDTYEVITGGVTVNASTGKFTMGEANVIIACRSKANNKFMVTEDVFMRVNSYELNLKKNMVVTVGKSGAIIKVEPASGGQSLTLANYQPAIDGLIDSGVLVKL